MVDVPAEVGSGAVVGTAIPKTLSQSLVVPRTPLLGQRIANHRARLQIKMPGTISRWSGPALVAQITALQDVSKICDIKVLSKFSIN